MSRLISHLAFIAVCALALTNAGAQCAKVYPTGSIAYCANVAYANSLYLGTFICGTPNSSSTYQWQVKNSTTWTNVAGATSSTFSPSSTGIYRAQFTLGASTEVSDSLSITVYSAPVVTISADSVSICTGSSVSLCATISGATSSQWWRNGVQLSGASSSCYTASLAGTYVCVGQNGWPCRAQDSIVVLVGATPPTPVVAGNGPVCVGDTLALIASSNLNGASYSWSGPNGFTSTLKNPKIAVSGAAAAGTYQATVTATGCVTSSSPASVAVSITCADSVWSGDVNYDKIVDNLDALEIAFASGQTGSARNSTSIAWQPRHCRDWATKLPGYSSINSKHADCDGDGIVSLSDTLAVAANYGLVHLKEINNPANKLTGVPDLYFDMTGITLLPGKTVSIPIKLGTSTTPVQDFAGLAARLLIDGITPSDEPALSYSGGWLGSYTMHFSKAVSYNRLDWAYARADHRDTSGSGVLAWLSFTIPAGSEGKPVHLSFDKVVLVDGAGTKITQFNALDTTAAVESATNVAAVGTIAPILTVYPNPSTGPCMAQISLPVAASYRISLHELNGRVIWQKSGQGHAGTQDVQLPSDALSSGVYFLRLQCEKIPDARPLRWLKY